MNEAYPSTTDAEAVSNSPSLLATLVDKMAEAIEAGTPVDIDDLVQQHPDLERPLRNVYQSLVGLCGVARTGLLGDDAGGGQPEELGDFRLVREIGRGGMGIVYEAEQLSLNRRVALKVLPLAGMLDARQLTRFQNEARAAATLFHPNIVPVFFVGCERSVHFYAMQLIDGSSLVEVISALRQEVGGRGQATSEERGKGGTGERGPSLDHSPPATHCAATTPSEICNLESEIDTQPVAALTTEHSTNPKRYFRRVAEIGAQVAQALDHAHQHGIVHRDVKPANILIDAAGKPWITDFGLALIEANGGITLSGDLVGTLRYMSPEQVSGRRQLIDRRTDIYSLGITLYELAAFRPAFDARDRRRLLRQIAEDDPRPIRQVRPSTPRDLETIILKSIDKEPAYRYATAKEFADDLLRFANDEPIHARRSSAPDRLFRWTRRHKAAALALLGILLMGVVSLSLALYQQTTAHRQSLQLTDQLTQQLYASQISLAQEAIQHHRIAEALEHLDACPSELRGWEWRYLRSQADRNSRTVEIGSTLITTGGSPAFSPDGANLAVARGDLLSVHDADNFDLQWSWWWDERATDTILCAAFSPDSRRVVVGMERGHAVMIDAQSGAELYKIAANPSSYAVKGIEFTADGQYFVACDQSGHLAMFNSDTGQMLWRVATTAGRGELISLDICGGRIATVDVSNNWVKIYSAVTGELEIALVDPSLVASYGDVAHADNPTCVAFSPDGSRVVTTGDDGMLKLWDAASGKLILSRKAHDDYARHAAFSPCGQWIATAGRDTTIRIWYADSLQHYATLDGHTDYATALAWRPGGRMLVSVGDDDTLRIWDAMAGPNPRTISGHLSWSRRWPREDSTASLAFTANGSTLVSNHIGVRAGSLITLWNASTGEELANLCGTCNRMFELNDLVATKNLNLIVGGGSDARIYLWRLVVRAFRPPSTGEVSVPGEKRAPQAAERIEPTTIANPSGYPVLAVDLDESGDRLAWSDSQGNVVLWDVLGAAERWTLRKAHVGGVRDIVFSPDARRLASAGDDCLVLLWDAETGALLHQLAGHQAPVHALAFSPDGAMLASAGADRAILVWNAATGALLGRHLSHAGLVRTLDFHPREARLISASADGTVKLWSPNLEQPLLTLRPPRNPNLSGREVYTAKFSPDGDSLFAGIEDGTIRGWETRSTLRKRFERQSVDLARRLVDALAQEHELYSQVIEELQSGRIQQERHILARAAQIALARSEHDRWAAHVRLERLRGFEKSILFPNAAASDLEREIASLRYVDEVQPEHPAALWWTGLGLYRLGRFEEALEVLNQQESRDRVCLRAPSFRTAAVKALTLYRLHRTDQSAAQLELAHKLLANPVWAEHRHTVFFRHLLREADVVITGSSRIPDFRQLKDISRPSPERAEYDHSTLAR